MKITLLLVAVCVAGCMAAPNGATPPKGPPPEGPPPEGPPPEGPPPEGPPPGCEEGDTKEECDTKLAAQTDTRNIRQLVHLLRRMEEDEVATTVEPAAEDDVQSPSGPPPSPSGPPPSGPPPSGPPPSGPPPSGPPPKGAGPPPKGAGPPPKGAGPPPKEKPGKGEHNPESEESMEEQDQDETRAIVNKLKTLLKRMEGDAELVCEEGQFKCAINGADKCNYNTFKCDGYPNCDDESDEESCQAVVCAEDKFKCPDEAYCQSKAQQCDTINDCTDGSDESVATCGDVPAEEQTKRHLRSLLKRWLA